MLFHESPEKVDQEFLKANFYFPAGKHQFGQKKSLFWEGACFTKVSGRKDLSELIVWCPGYLSRGYYLQVFPL